MNNSYTTPISTGHPVYIINLKNRLDRRRFILQEFHGRMEFDFYLVEAHAHKIGSLGLWLTIREILQNVRTGVDDFIILCQDDHLFTKDYSKERLLNNIAAAKEKNADVLLGGVSGFTGAFQVATELYWVEAFSGLQFTVIFKKFFQSMLDTDFRHGGAADLKISALTTKKFFIYPFISVQKDFGYSDVTPGNNVKGRVEDGFKDSDAKVKVLQEAVSFYKKIKPDSSIEVNAKLLENTVIPAYIINLSERADRRVHIDKQFADKPEFDIKFVEGCKNKHGAIGLWRNICTIIRMAIENEDDVIVICTDDHEFTPQYNHHLFISNILRAHSMHCNLLIGGLEGFNLSLPLTDNLYWVDCFWGTTFMVVFKKFFEAILKEPFAATDTCDGKFSEMTSHKMLIHPFISSEKESGYSDIAKPNKETVSMIRQQFNSMDQRLKIQKKMHEHYLKK